MHEACHHQAPVTLPHCTFHSLDSQRPGSAFSAIRLGSELGGVDPRLAAAEVLLFLLFTPFFLPTFKLSPIFLVLVSQILNTIDKETTNHQKPYKSFRKKTARPQKLRQKSEVLVMFPGLRSIQDSKDHMRPRLPVEALDY